MSDRKVLNDTEKMTVFRGVGEERGGNKSIERMETSEKRYVTWVSGAVRINSRRRKEKMTIK